MKNNIYKIISSLYSIKWNLNSKTRILIETNEYFTENKWQSILKNLNKNCEIKYFKNKYHAFKLLPEADAAFVFGGNSSFDLSNIKMIYYGVSQPEINSKVNCNFVHYAKGFSSKAIAEYCLTYSLVILNNAKYYLSNQEEKKWKQTIIGDFTNLSITNKNIGILGLGNNGQSIAELFKKVGCKVYGYDLNEKLYVYVDVFCKSMDELFQNSDILIVAVNLNSDNKYLINRRTLNLMKPTSYLINISRGNVLNENDLYYALKKESISGAVLDVTAAEPLSKYNKLWELNNIIITPHISGNINMFSENIMADFCCKLDEYLTSCNV